MRLEVLGPVALVDGGAEPRQLQRGQRLVLAALAAHGSDPVPAPRLADALWGDRPPADPGAALRSQVARLRRLLPPGALPHERGGYRLDRAAVDADLDEFERLFAAARRAPPEERVDLLRRAARLWRGPAFGEDGDHPLVRAVAVRLEELRAAAVEALAEALLDSGDVDLAVAEMQAHVAREPLRERSRELLMRALHRAGRVGDALEVYGTYRRLMARELGLEPSPRLAALQRELLTADAAPPALLSVRWVGTRSGSRVATGRAGAGPSVVLLPAYVGSMREIADRDDVLLSRFFAALAWRATVVTYDRSGTGMTRGEPDDLTLRAAVDEAEDVLAGLGVSAAPVLAPSAAGPVALSLAARRPDLVARLVLVGTYASGPATSRRPGVREAVVQLVRSDWGIGSRLLADLWVPDASPQETAAAAAYQRACATPGVAAAYLEAMYRYDASAALPHVRQPVLVLHYERDRAIPFSAGQALAQSLPRARLVPLPGSWHLPPAADAARVAGLALRFLLEDGDPVSPGAGAGSGPGAGARPADG